MTTVYLAPTFGAGYQAFTTGGLPLNAGLIYTYIAGGTTPQATYTTSAGSVQNANPIVLGVDGRTPAEVWMAAGAAYRFDVKDSLGNLIQTYDNLYGIGDPNGPNNSKGYFPLTSVAGTANAITAAASAGLTALAANQLFVMTPSLTNTGATAIVITPSGASALPSTAIRAGNSALVGGELHANIPVALLYDGTNLQLMGPVFKQPTRTVLTSGTAATYTTPTGATRLDVQLVGGGSGGMGGNGGSNSSAATASSFSDGTVTLTANGGAAGVNSGSGFVPAAATATGGDINIPGTVGSQGAVATASGNGNGAQGANSFFGGGGAVGYNTTPGAAATNSGSAGAGGSAGTASTLGGASGNAGAYCRKLIKSPSATYTYTVGAKSTGTTAGAGAIAGSDGAAGIIIVDEYYD